MQRFFLGFLSHDYEPEIWNPCVPGQKPRRFTLHALGTFSIISEIVAIRRSIEKQYLHECVCIFLEYRPTLVGDDFSNQVGVMTCLLENNDIVTVSG